VSRLELAELSELDFASWKHPRRPGVDGAEEPDRDHGRVLTLERLLQLVLDADRPVQLQVETKHPSRHGGRVERALLDLLTRYGLAAPSNPAAARVWVLSYALSSLRRVHALAPGLPTVLNTDFVLPWLLGGRLPAGVCGLGVGLRAARTCPGMIRRVRQRGGWVQVFTVDQTHDIDYLAGLGVDGIISNYPARVLHRLDRNRASRGPQ
jgi:glycerophosphoryl diester phosphodiesterase